MSRKMSDETKQSLRLGTGTGNTYIPYINTSEFNSQGTTSVIVDWKTGRGVHCMSQSEANWYYILRWDDTNVDIREQFPLDREITNRIAYENGFKLPKNGEHVMTTDFLVTRADGTFVAHSVKPDKELKNRTLELLTIEKLYWLEQGADFKMLFGNEVNKIFASNIRLVTEFYAQDKIQTDIDMIKHKIARKVYECDLSVRPLTLDFLNEIERSNS